MANLDDRSGPDIRDDHIATTTTQFYTKFAFDDTISATFHGRKSTQRTRILKYIAEWGTLGAGYLLSKWFPAVEKRLETEPCPLNEATHVFIENSFGQSELVIVKDYLVDGQTFSYFLKECSRLLDDACVEDASQRAYTNTSCYPQYPNIKTFDYRCNRFILNPFTGQFISIHDLPRVMSSDVDECEEGIKDDQHIMSQRLLFGENRVVVPVKTITQLLIDEVLHPFNVFQLFSILIWSMENYFMYAMIILLMTGGSVALTLHETMANQKKLEEMAHFSCRLRVLRKGKWVEIESAELVPGDVIDLEECTVLPCDLILLNGDCVVDESMLTGETVPLTKAAISYEDFREFYHSQRSEPSYSLYSGTKVLRSRPRHGRPATALVLNTGFLTAKGVLIQSILFPRPNKFRFYRDSMVCIGVLAGIACVGFVGSVFVMRRLNYPWPYIITRALDLITVVVPPALPATMSIGAIFALTRLKGRDIFCISPPRINVCAKVGLMCFDKTGTLTEEGLDVLGVVPCTIAADSTPKPLSNQAPLMRLTPSIGQQCRPLVQLMATCHSIQRINETLVGDPLDLKMFSFSGWILEEVPEDANEAIVPVVIKPPGSESFDLDDAINLDDDDDDAVDPMETLLEMGIIRCFEFNASIRRMSVVVKELESEVVSVMTKGSPESIKAICAPDTIPSDFDQVLAKYSHAGYRVIACAWKGLPDGTTWFRVQRMRREEVETGLSFLGFLLFENKLKEQTTPVIRVLNQAHIASVMVTGDNLYTAVAVARACGIVNSDSSVLVPVVPCEDDSDSDSSGSDDPMKKRKLGLWESLDSGKVTGSDQSLIPFETSPYALAMTGESFERYTRAFSFKTLRPMMERCRVFARMSPHQKQTLVEMFQSFGWTVGFCGDGANDCGALKAADVGVSLSAAEASVAAPFTSRSPHIGCVVELLREGRAALATSFSCFKFMALYSMIQFTTLTLMYVFRTSLSDGQFIYIDLLLIIPFGILLSRFGPAPSIHPRPPTARLISAPVLLSIIGQVAIQLVVQFGIAVAVAHRYGFANLTMQEPSKLGNAALFLSSIFLYSTIALVFSFGYPHRARFFLPFTLFLGFSFLIGSVLCMVRVSWMDWLLSLYEGMGWADGVALLLISIGHLIAALVYDLLLVPWLSTCSIFGQKPTERSSV